MVILYNHFLLFLYKSTGLYLYSINFHTYSNPLIFKLYILVQRQIQKPTKNYFKMKTRNKKMTPSKKNQIINDGNEFDDDESMQYKI